MRQIGWDSDQVSMNKSLKSMYLSQFWLKSHENNCKRLRMYDFIRLHIILLPKMTLKKKSEKNSEISSKCRLCLFFMWLAKKKNLYMLVFFFFWIISGSGMTRHQECMHTGEIERKIDFEWPVSEWMLGCHWRETETERQRQSQWRQWTGSVNAQHT